MWYLAIFIFVFTTIQLLVAAVNLIFKPPLKHSIFGGNPLVSVLIPARNEAENIGVLLNGLVNQPYDNLEIIVFDDQSEDLTSNIVRSMAETDQRIKLVVSENLPDGWLGKNYACHSLSGIATGDYFLFVDADVLIGSNIIRSSVSYAEKFRLGLLSVFPGQIMKTTGEKVTVPIMNFILLTLLPLPLVQWSPFRSLSAANGQYMLFKSAIYKRFYPHEQVKKSKVEDIEIMRFLKAKKVKVACLTGDKSVQCRMYSCFSEAVNGFSKNIIAFFGNSFMLAILFWLITTFGFIPVLISFPFNIFVVYIVILLLIRLFVSIASYQRIFYNILYMIPQQLIMGYVILCAFLNKYFFHYKWKGRNIG